MQRVKVGSLSTLKIFYLKLEHPVEAKQFFLHQTCKIREFHYFFDLSFRLKLIRVQISFAIFKSVNNLKSVITGYTTLFRLWLRKQGRLRSIMVTVITGCKPCFFSSKDANVPPHSQKPKYF